MNKLQNCHFWVNYSFKILGGLKVEGVLFELDTSLHLSDSL